MIIAGAGLAGLIAGNLFPRAEIYEASSEDAAPHKALLRFRSAAVGDAVGIPFRAVTVRKAVWCDGSFRTPTPRIANWYARKVIGSIADRSIWDLEPETRYIAPEDFPYQLRDMCSNRLHYNSPVVLSEVLHDEPVISTVPMNVMTKQLRRDDAPEFRFAGITVERYRVEDADVYQTIYFPSPMTSVYRASITGSLLIVESMGGTTPDEMEEVATAFGLYPTSFAAGGVQKWIKLESARQSYGKIAPIDDGWRRAFIRSLTVDHGVYSLGRFATWRNILLDDIIQDIAVIKRLLVADSYDIVKHDARSR